MRKTIFYILLLLSLLALFVRFGYDSAVDLLGLKGRGGIKITSYPQGAAVFLNGMEVGKTPYTNENLEAKKYQVKLSGEKTFWEGLVNINSGTLSVVNRELAESIASSSGEALTLENGQGVRVVSHPEGATVEIDGKAYGQTPLMVSEITPSEHLFLLSHDNYLKRSIRASLPEKMLLNLEVNLAVSETDLAPVVLPTITPESKLVVKQTPVGFLRVRNGPSTSSKEVGRVSSGDTLTLLEELSGWYKIKLDDETEGYVSASYVQKQ